MLTRTRENLSVAGALALIVALSVFQGAAPPVWGATVYFAIGLFSFGSSLYAARRHVDQGRATVSRGAVLMFLMSLFALDKLFPERGFGIPAMLLVTGLLIYESRPKLSRRLASLAKWLRTTAFVRWYVSVRATKR